MAEKPPPKKRGRKPILDPVLVAAALADLLGNISATAKRFHVDRSSLRELIDKRPSLQKVLTDAREGMLDNAESSCRVVTLPNGTCERIVGGLRLKALTEALSV